MPSLATNNTAGPKNLPVTDKATVTINHFSDLATALATLYESGGKITVRFGKDPELADLKHIIKTSKGLNGSQLCARLEEYALARGITTDLSFMSKSSRYLGVSRLVKTFDAEDPVVSRIQNSIVSEYNGLSHREKQHFNDLVFVKPEGRILDLKQVRHVLPGIRIREREVEWPTEDPRPAPGNNPLATGRLPSIPLPPARVADGLDSPSTETATISRNNETLTTRQLITPHEFKVKWAGKYVDQKDLHAIPKLVLTQGIIEGISALRDIQNPTSWLVASTSVHQNKIYITETFLMADMSPQSWKELELRLVAERGQKAAAQVISNINCLLRRRDGTSEAIAKQGISALRVQAKRIGYPFFFLSGFIELDGKLKFKYSMVSKEGAHPLFGSDLPWCCAAKEGDI